MITNYFKADWTEEKRKQYRELMLKHKLTKQEHDFAYEMYKLEQFMAYGEM